MNDDLILEGGKAYQRSKVIMLPTEKASRIHIVSGKLKYSDARISNTLWNSQHLYFLSNENIKDGDWYLNQDNVVFQCKKEFQPMYIHCRKIIATTNNSLKIESELDAYYRNGIGGVTFLSRPSDDFLKAYCEQGGIDEVLVEYINNGDIDFGTTLPNFNNGIQFILKVAEDNTITIKPYKVKDSW